jgi:serine/threonine protein kinase
MGAVYLARQSRPRRTVAVKVILPGLIEENTREQFLVRFRREADAIAALDHINIMPVYEYSEQGDTAYLVMPYVTGGTLRDRLEQSHSLSLEEAIYIIDQAAAGLDCAHAQGIIHRDLKPGNMLFHADGRLLLADFGLAKVLKDVENSGLSLLTSAGTIIGTPEYLSPEQGTGNPLDVRTDIYSLGIVLYHMLTGRVPFTGTSPVAIAIRHAMVEPPPMRQFNPQITPAVEAVVMKAIAKAPEDRFSSAGELARALRQAASQGHNYLQHELLSKQKIVDDDDTNPIVSIKTFQTKEEAEKPLPELPDAEELLAEQVEKTTNTAATPELNERIAALPTLLIHPDSDNLQHAETNDEFQSYETHDNLHNAENNDEFYNAENNDGHYNTEIHEESYNPEAHDNPYLPQEGLVHNMESSSTPEAVTVADTPQLVKPNPKAIRLGKAEIVEHPDNDEQLQIRSFSQQATIRTRFGTKSQPLRTVLIASFLILFIVGSLATYQHLRPTSSGQGDTKTKLPQTQVAQMPAHTNTPTPQPQVPQIVLPTPPSSISVGQMIYGTNLPSSPCDKQGGQWTNASDASVTCTADGAQITAKQNMTSFVTGTFLEQMPHGAQMPSDFIIQTQVTVNPNSPGKFGIYFRSQPNDPQKSYLFLIDQQSATWTIYYYHSDTNAYEALNQTPVTTLLPNPVQGTVTIDLQISGNSYNVFINGKSLDGAVSTAWYPSGTIGLAVSQGANVIFKNVAIYAPPN